MVVVLRSWQTHEMHLLDGKRYRVRNLRRRENIVKKKKFPSIHSNWRQFLSLDHDFVVWYFFLHLSSYQLQSSKESNFVNTNIVFELHNTNSFQKIVEIPQYHHRTKTTIFEKRGIIFTENFQGNKGWWLAWTPLSNHRSWRWRRGKT